MPFLSDHHRFRPRLVRVGVTGHRLNRLTQADEPLLREKIREVLERIRQIAQDVLTLPDSPYASNPPIFRVISPLAEGADRIAAQEAVALGFELQCPLPFDQDEYGKDFTTPESRAEYRTMLAKATAVLELDGSRETPTRENEAYEAVGREVLNHSDVLIAIGDGKEAAGQGGTGQIVEEAVHMGILVLWIRSSPPHDICLLAQETKGQHLAVDIQELPERLKHSLLSRFSPINRRPGQ